MEQIPVLGAQQPTGLRMGNYTSLCDIPDGPAFFDAVSYYFVCSVPSCKRGGICCATSLASCSLFLGSWQLSCRVPVSSRRGG